jgi:3'-phosphoadenosine 5'-phosphosulfate sulfotransferase (PAPS reductase)/FAD synthetase
LPRNWVEIAPAIEWTDVDVWVWLLLNNIEFNRQYRYGFARCGCLVCPYQSDYTDMLIKEYYPNLWYRWKGVLKQSYETNHVAKNFKWTLQEYIDGMWKTGKAKNKCLFSFPPQKSELQNWPS